MWKLKEQSVQDKKDGCLKIKNALENMQTGIKEIKNLQIGINDNELKYANYDVVLMIDFENSDDFFAYQNHSKHKEFVSIVKEIRSEKASVDYYI